MDKCPNCGNKINRMDVLCPRCGAVVEDVHVKIGLKVNKSGIAVISDSAVPKKNIPQNFIVYNEDFPSEEYETCGSANTEDESSDIASSIYGNASGIPESEDEHDYYVPSDTEVSQDEYDQEESDQSKPYVPGTLKAIKEQEETDNEDYSERYLEKIKDLPEIDDISNFDPEEYMKKYRLSKGVYGDVPAVAMPENKNFNEKVTKHYLEIEEIIPPLEKKLPEGMFLTDSAVEDRGEPFPDAEPSSEIKEPLKTAIPQSEPQSKQTEIEPDDAPMEHRDSSESAPVEHRYNPDAPHRYRKKEKLERKINLGKTVEVPPVEVPPVEAPLVEAPLVEAPSVEASPVEASPVEAYAPSMEAQADQAQEVQEQPAETRAARRRESREDSKPPKRNEKRRIPAVASVIIWLAVVAALFAGSFFFDRYVKTSYGNYNFFIYRITDGKINLGAQAK